MQVPIEEEKMRTTTHCSRLVATVLVVGTLTLGASAGMAAQHEPKPGLGYPSQAATAAIRGVRDVDIRDAAHMALIENARRHGLEVENMKPIGSRQFYVGSRVTSSQTSHRGAGGGKGAQLGAGARHGGIPGQQKFDPTPPRSTEPSQSVNASGGFSWTYPGVLASLSLGLALLVGGIVLAARRFRSRVVTA
jgi:hypothetical protein